MKQARSQVNGLLNSTVSESVEKVKVRRSSQTHKCPLLPGHPTCGPPGKFDPRFDFVAKYRRISPILPLTKQFYYDTMLTMVNQFHICEKSFRGRSVLTQPMLVLIENDPESPSHTRQTDDVLTKSQPPFTTYFACLPGSGGDRHSCDFLQPLRRGE